MKAFLVFVALLLAGCGGGGGSGTLPFVAPRAASLGSDTFWAYDFVNDQDYQLMADKVAEGDHCYIYLEKGQQLTQGQVDAVKQEFDTNIYPTLTTSFGREPNPGIDNDPKIFVLLLAARDGFNPLVSTSYVGGYFNPNHEYVATSQNHSNEKEIIYLNINPVIRINPNSTGFYSILAHEFMHLIHWEQKTHQHGVWDETWLIEALATLSQTHCGYDVSYGFVRQFEQSPSDSLTNWSGNYGLVYMWAHYIKEQFGSDIFSRMLTNNLAGIDSVNSALQNAGSPKDFAATFRDWSVAVYSGNAINWPGHPEWSYTSLNTWPGAYNGITIPGLFSDLARKDATTLQPLDAWSLGYYSYTATTTEPTGSLTWTPAAATEQATFVDSGNDLINFTIDPGTAYNFTTKGYLIIQNPSDSATGAGGSVSRATRSALPVGNTGNLHYPHAATVSPKSAMQFLQTMSASPAIADLARQTGQPQPVCVDHVFQEQEKTLRIRRRNPPF